MNGDIKISYYNRNVKNVRYKFCKHYWEFAQLVLAALFLGVLLLEFNIRSQALTEFYPCCF